MPGSVFSELLDRYISASPFTSGRLAELADVPKATIVNWRTGKVRRPRASVDIVRLAAALGLTEPQLDELLGSAGHPPLKALMRSASARQQALLQKLLPRLASGQAANEDAAAGLQHSAADGPRARALAPGSQMPLASNPLFVGRLPELGYLAERLLPVGSARATVAVAGLGGIGKTQLASEFVHRYGGAFEGGVFWIGFAEPGAVAAQVAICGGPGGLELQPDWSRLGLDAQLRLVRAAWQSVTPRLLVFDNCEDEALLERWRPTTGGCRVLLTTRQLEWDATLGVAVLPLAVLPRAESVALLLQHIPEHTGATDELNAIAAELGDLPLALNLAGRYLHRYRYVVTPGAYLDQLRSVTPLAHPSMQMGGHSPTAHVQHVERTLALSVDRLVPSTPTDARAMALLERLACFAPGEPVTRPLLAATLAHNTENSALAVHDAVLRLFELGLAEPSAGGALQMHRLVAAVVRRRGVGAAVDDVAGAVLERAQQLNGAGDVVEMSALRPHLHVVTDAAIDRAAAPASDLAYALGYHLWLLAEYPAAQHYLLAALRLLEREPAADPVRVGSALNLLALTYQLACDYDMAQRHFEQALDIWEHSVGPDDPLTIDDVNNLGYLRLLQGDYAAAEQHLRRALQARRRRFGVWSLECARSIHNVGYLALKQGRLRRARRYLLTALKVRRKLLPPAHLSTAYTLNFLGETMFAMGEIAAAEALHQEALAMRHALFGERHHDTAESLYNLGRVRAAQGAVAAARELLEQAIALYIGLVGQQHRDTAFAETALGGLLLRGGEPQEARAHLLRALAAWEQHGGPEHPELVPVLCEVGALELVEGRTSAARRAIERARSIALSRLGPSHPDTQRVAALYAALPSR